MNFRTHVIRLGAALAGLVIIFTANPASASEQIPAGYVKNYPSWCDWQSQHSVDEQLYTDAWAAPPAKLHMRQRSDGYLCAWVSIDNGWTGTAWKAVKIRRGGWSTPAYWGYSTTNNVTAAIGTLYNGCIDVWAEVGAFGGWPASSTNPPGVEEPVVFCAPL